MHDRVGDELQLVAEASHEPPGNLLSCRRKRRHADAHDFERELQRFRVLVEPSASQSDERAGCGEAASRFRFLIVPFRPRLPLLEQIEEVCCLIVGEWFFSPKPLFAPIWHEKVCEGGCAIGLPRLHLKVQFVRTDEDMVFRACRRVGNSLIVGPVERGDDAGVGDE